MNEDRFNIEVRKFLKEVGVTSQREIERAVRKALAQWRADKVHDARARIDALSPCSLDENTQPNHHPLAGRSAS